MRKKCDDTANKEGTEIRRNKSTNAKDVCFLKRIDHFPCVSVFREPEAVASGSCENATSIRKTKRKQSDLLSITGRLFLLLIPSSA